MGEKDGMREGHLRSQKSDLRSEISDQKLS